MATIQQQQLKSVQRLLKYVFVVVPIVAGADKFSNLLTHWDQYLPPTITESLPFSALVFMKIVGIIEIIAGIIVLKKPYLGGCIVASWLTLIALNLLLSCRYIDVGVRDLVMAAAAFSMAQLSKIVKE